MFVLIVFVMYRKSLLVVGVPLSFILVILIDLQVFFFFSSFLEAKNVATISPLKEDLTQGVYIYMLFHLSSSPQSRSLAWVPLYG